jgi:hypothetical protein
MNDAQARAALHRLVEAYLETLDDRYKDEYYMTSRELARQEIDKFLGWLMGEGEEGKP